MSMRQIDRVPGRFGCQLSAPKERLGGDVYRREGRKQREPGQGYNGLGRTELRWLVGWA